MVRRRHIAAVPGAIFGAGPFLTDVREFLMDFGLTGESLGVWKGVVLTLSAGLVWFALWPDIRAAAGKVRNIFLKRKEPPGFHATLNMPDPKELRKRKAREK